MEASTSRKRTLLPNVTDDQKRLCLDARTTSENSTESTYSMQQHDTDVARDTSDTDDSDDSMTEYEVNHYESVRNPMLSTGESDEIDEIAELGAVAVALNGNLSDIDMGLLADSSTEPSTSPSSCSDADPGLPRQDYLDFWHCIKCKGEIKNQHVPFCSKCYTQRKMFYSERHRRRRFGRNNSFPLTAQAPPSLVRCASESVAAANNDDVDVVDGPITKASSLESHFKTSVDSGIECGIEAPTPNHGVGSITINIDHHPTRRSQEEKLDTQVPSQEAKLDNQVPSQEAKLEKPVPSQEAKLEKPGPSGCEKVTFIIGDNAQEIVETAVDSVEAPKFPVCQLCSMRPADAGFAHHSTIHLDYACFVCAKKVWKEAAYCPLCRLKIQGVYRGIKI